MLALNKGGEITTRARRVLYLYRDSEARGRYLLVRKSNKCYIL